MPVTNDFALISFAKDSKSRNFTFSLQFMQGMGVLPDLYSLIKGSITFF